MSSISYRHSLAILCCALPFAVTAQTSNSIPSLDNIVVTPGRITQLESDVIGDVTVINKKELERAGQTSVAEILAKQPGVQFYSSGGPQSVTGVYLRGTNPNQTLVLMDGLRINSSTAGGVNWNTIDPSIIERIEILRGSASSLYGSDAIGGVINIITRKTGEDRPLSAWGNVGYGTHDTFKSSVGLSGAKDGWDYALSTFMASSSGFNATRPELGEFYYHPDKDGYERHGFSGSLGYSWKPDHHIGLSMVNNYINGDFDSGQPSMFGNPHPAVARTRQQAYSITSTNQITPTWQSILRFGLTKETSDSRAGTSWNTSFESLQRSWNWQNNFSINENHNITALLERLEERIQHSEDFNGTTRNTNAVGVIYRGKFNKLRTQASVRNDNISSYGSKRTGSLGLDYDLSDNWSVGVAGNTGFRAPTFSDLYYPTADYPGAAPASNPNLKPEKSRNIEAHIKYANDTTQLNATFYQNKIRDLIVLDTNYTPFNTGRATIKGLTLSAEHVLGNTRIRASADFMNPRDDESHKQLSRRAKQAYSMGINHRLNAWDLGAEYQFVGKRYNDSENERRLGSYSLVNLTAAYDFTKNVGVQVRWNNVFDKNYTNAYGYNMPGSNVFVNLSFRM